MKRSASALRLCCLMVLATLCASAGVAQPLGTAFTCQGRLASDGTPSTGPFDLQFALFDAATSGTQIGGTLAFEDVTVTEGLFTLSARPPSPARHGGSRSACGPEQARVPSPSWPGAST